MKKILLPLLFLLIAFTLVQIWVTKDKTGQKEQAELEISQQNPTTAAKSDEEKVQELTGGEMPTGGDFTLTDQNGKTVRDEDFRGKVMLVFFGFTRCQDVCPISIGTLSKVMAALGDKANQVAPIFITVDPEYDTVPVIKQWLTPFDSRVVGLTGTKDQIRDVAHIYKTYYTTSPTLPPLGPVKEKEEDHSAHGAPKSADYNVDHSAFISMMGKDGKLIKLFPYDVAEQDVINAVNSTLQ